MSVDREKEQLEGLRRGDLSSFRWVYDQYHRKVFGYCLKLVNSHVVAEEITEDVFVKIWEKRSKIDPTLPIGHLLLKITKDYVWNHLKKESRIKEQQRQYVQVQSTSYSSDIESKLILKDYLDITEAAIRQLPEKRRVVFNLRYKTGLDNSEIARQLGISETTVRVHLSKATQFLRKYLKAHPEISFILCFHLLANF